MRQNVNERSNTTITVLTELCIVSLSTCQCQTNTAGDLMNWQFKLHG